MTSSAVVAQGLRYPAGLSVAFPFLCGSHPVAALLLWALCRSCPLLVVIAKEICHPSGLPVAHDLSVLSFRAFLKSCVVVAQTLVFTLLYSLSASTSTVVVVVARGLRSSSGSSVCVDCHVGRHSLLKVSCWGFF